MSVGRRVCTGNGQVRADPLKCERRPPITRFLHTRHPVGLNSAANAQATVHVTRVFSRL